jgi:hypothetical protein
MQLDIGHDGRIHASVGERAFDLFGVQFDGRSLLGRATADVGVSAAKTRPREVRFELVLRNNRLTGSLTTVVPWVAAITGFVDLHRPV